MSRGAAGCRRGMRRGARRVNGAWPSLRRARAETREESWHPHGTWSASGVCDADTRQRGRKHQQQKNESYYVYTHHHQRDHTAPPHLDAEGCTQMHASAVRDDQYQPRFVHCAIVHVPCVLRSYCLALGTGQAKFRNGRDDCNVHLAFVVMHKQQATRGVQRRAPSKRRS